MPFPPNMIPLEDFFGWKEGRLVQFFNTKHMPALMSRIIIVGDKLICSKKMMRLHEPGDGDDK